MTGILKGNWMARTSRYPHCPQAANFIRTIPDRSGNDDSNHDINGDDY